MENDVKLNELLGSEGEKVVMHILADLLPRVLGNVAEAALSPLLSRVDRALGMAQSTAMIVREGIQVVREGVQVVREGVGLVGKVADAAHDGIALAARIAEDVAELRRISSSGASSSGAGSLEPG